jgi:hypothetical protein
MGMASSLRALAGAGLIAAAALGGAPAMAVTNLVQNGGFEQTTLSGSSGFGDRYPANQVAGWTTSGYNFVFAPGEQDTVGADGVFGRIWLWGPRGQDNAQSLNGMPDASPVGGNFVAFNGSFDVGPISQVVNGLTPGQDYTVRFWWAAAQQRGYNGDTQQNWTVSLGQQSFVTETVTNLNHGFVPWRQESFTFRATSASSLLSFLASGTPAGTPPFTLLDGVELFSTGTVPEPATWGMFLIGFGAMGIAVRRRRRVPAQG